MHPNREAADDLERLLRGVADGDDVAWAALVARYRGRVARVARSHGLAAHEADDVAQETWLRLYRHVGTLRDPLALGAWLETIARRASLRALSRMHREVLVGDEPWLGEADEDAEPSAALFSEERRDAVARAVERLPPRQRELMHALLSDAPPSYAEISAKLGIPIGSIGPTRGRCVERIRRAIAAEQS